MSSPQADDERILTVAKDGAEAKIPKSKPFSRSFILHESDLLSILNNLINNSNNDTNDPGETNSIAMNVPPFAASTNKDNNNSDNNDSNNINDNNNNNNNSDSHNATDKPNALNGSGTIRFNNDNNNNNNNNNKTMPNTDADLIDTRWTKRIKKLISNPNLSAETKTELISDLFKTATTRTRLALERRLKTGSQKLLGAGIVETPADAIKRPSSADQTSSKALSRTPPITSEAVANNSVANAPSRDADGAESDTEADSDSFDPPDDTDSDVANDTSGDTDGDEDDAEVDDDDDDDDDDVDETIDDIRTPYYWANDLLITCARQGIALSKPAKYRVMSVGKKLGRLFSISIDSNKLETQDRRFYILKDGMVHYQYHTKEIRMPVYKLIASLSLPTSKLFRTLRAISFPIPVKKYSSYDKFLLSTIVDAANISPNSIPCTKLREICSE